MNRFDYSEVSNLKRFEYYVSAEMNKFMHILMLMILELNLISKKKSI